MPWMEITCRCGHRDDFDRFTRTPIAGELPPAHFQCPACGHAWKIERKGQARTTESGFVIPADRQVVESQRRL